MTILPKKKQSKDKAPEKSGNEATDSSGGHPHTSHSYNHVSHTHSASERAGRGHSGTEKGPRRVSPNRWPTANSRDIANERGGRRGNSPQRWAASSSREPATERQSRRNSPPHWSGPSPMEERLPSHESSMSYEPYEVEGFFNSENHHKKRHRSSPHRTSRKHRHGHKSSHSEHPHHSGALPTSRGASPVPSCSGCPAEDDPPSDTGNNSEDEYIAPPAPDNPEELERWFEATLKDKKNLIIKRMGDDGACLFRSVADQVYGDQEMHDHVRQSCCDYMAKNSDFFKQYVTEEFSTYLNRKRQAHSHGNHIEMQAMCELYNRPIEVYQYSLEPINTFNSIYKTDNEPIRLSYHKNMHYNSVVDPHKATIGVGLGLPGHQPGGADKKLMTDALKVSEEHHLEQTMLEDKLRETDWEVTQETIEEQVARESYLQWLKENDKRDQRSTLYPPRVSATCSSAAASESRANHSPRNRSGNSSPQTSPGRPPAMDVDSTACDSSSVPAGQSPRLQPSCSSHIPDVLMQPSATEGAVGGAALPSSMFGLSDWDEDDIIAQVMAQSQQEYLDSLKKSASGPSTSKDS